MSSIENLIDTIEKYENFLNGEYKNAEAAVHRNLIGQFITKENRAVYNEEIIKNTIVRCLGVALFVQSLDVPYDIAGGKYDEIKEKLDALRKEI